MCQNARDLCKRYNEHFIVPLNSDVLNITINEKNVRLNSTLHTNLILVDYVNMSR